MIKPVSSMATAMSIVNMVTANEDVMYSTKVHWYIEAYQNGREQGLIITDITNIAFYICENRHSDSPTVYVGNYSMQSISENAYKHCNSFKNINEASDWLIKEILNFENRSK